MSSSDKLRFFHAWLKAPLRVASITPSGTGLSALITCEIGPATGPILELGPGTGVFTRALLARGVAERDISMIELGGEFVPLLRRRFPAARILRTDAREIGRDDLLHGTLFGAVISGLPLISMKPEAVIDIVGGSFSRLKPDGAFYQFTYGPVCPIRNSILKRLHLRAEWIGHTFRNFPPASVYRIARETIRAQQALPPQPA
ncbi:MAG: phospholipid methyltransferase [Rudaea sp.]|uniref:class I SAM-dependent methyltransferase n=1 Tax=unclassified Rudaea TaxID=2627037 RepID=UPI0010F82E4F|nr:MULTISPECIES: SAM-dependent methyltransferase [unclassified Rudaea]MBN8886894.1 phospholipid methyltransferase [Rudaea sp.]MBR0346461.1 phospholipid methyltransferase [Rudaea sp.]